MDYYKKPHESTHIKVFDKDGEIILMANPNIDADLLGLEVMKLIKSLKESESDE